MSGRPMSTLGFERAANPYLDPGLSQERFVERLLASAPPFPPYYRRMKRINSEGPRLLGGLPGGLPGLGPIPVDRFAARLATGEPVVVDLRDYLAFGGAHVPGSFGIGLGGNLATWAAWAVPYDRPILLVGDGEGGEGGENGGNGGGGDREAVERAVRALVRVGLDDVEGYLDGGIEAWLQAGEPLAEIRQIGPLELARELAAGDGLGVLDVRNDGEWAGGHIEGAVHVMAGQVAERLDELPDRGRPLAVVCGTGYRSTVAASVLQRHGFDRVLNVAGGMTAWHKAGLPTVR
jgi:hydroxyacylglutathione hydrolase